MNKDEALTRAQQVIRANNKALEQPAQEPVGAVQEGIVSWYRATPKNGTLLYTHPHQWQGLTDDEQDKLYADWERGSWNYNTFADAIEQALKEKNHED